MDSLQPWHPRGPADLPTSVETVPSAASPPPADAHSSPAADSHWSSEKGYPLPIPTHPGCVQTVGQTVAAVVDVVVVDVVVAAVVVDVVFVVAAAAALVWWGVEKMQSSLGKTSCLLLACDPSRAPA